MLRFIGMGYLDINLIKFPQIAKANQDTILINS